MNKPRRYPAEIRERAVRMVRESGEREAIGRVAEQLGVHQETLRNWVRRAQIDDGLRPGLTTEQLEELKQLKPGSPSK